MIQFTGQCPATGTTPPSRLSVCHLAQGRIDLNQSCCSSVRNLFARLHIQPYRLPLKAPWPAAVGGCRQEVEGWLLRLTDDDFTGHGDCCPLPEAGTENRQAAADALADLPATLVSRTDLIALLDTLETTPAVRCALETAWLDLESRKRRLPLRKLLHADASDTVAVNHFGGRACKARNLRLPNRSVVKFKLGSRDWQEECRCLEKWVAIHPGIRLRLDVNGVWEERQARAAFEILEALPVDLIEEPLRRPTLDGLARLQAATTIPLALDESLHVLGTDVVLDHKPVSTLVIKPAAVGGLLRSWDLARRALTAGLRVIITSMGESAVGVAATAQLAAAVEALAPGEHHGLATSTWLARDLAAPPPIQNGRMMLDHRIGTGVTP